MPSFRGIHHIAMVTGDMDGTIRFWRDLMGLPLIGGIGNASYRQYFFQISPQIILAFFEWPGAEPIEERDPGWIVRGPLVFDHLCLEVADEEELWQLKARLEAAEIWVTEVEDHQFIHSFFTNDPNGATVEIAWAVPGVDLESKASLSDPDASPVALEGRPPRPERWPAAPRTEPPDQRRRHPGPLAALLRPAQQTEPEGS